MFSNQFTRNLTNSSRLLPSTITILNSKSAAMRRTTLGILIIALLLSALHSFSQEGRITGRVTDAGGSGIEGVTVTNELTKVRSLTDTSGAFSIVAVKGNILT